MNIPDGVTEPAWLEVDLDAMASNIKALKDHIGPRIKLMAVVKADGYGIGSLMTAETALNSGAEYLAVARISEAVYLRQHEVKAPILNFGFCTDRELSMITKHNIIQTVHRQDFAKVLNDFAKSQSKIIKIHVNIDTGMCRSGLPIQETVQFFKKLKTLSNLKLEGIFTHFATASSPEKSFVYEQIKQFQHIKKKILNLGFKGILFHAANSYATVKVPESLFDLVRPGAAIYGIKGMRGVLTSFKIKPVVNFRAVVSHVNKVKKGTGISYGHMYTTNKRTTIATIQAGYADGVKRLLFNTGTVIVRGEKYPIVGYITMDQTMIDVGYNSDICVGDIATIIGQDHDKKISIDDIACSAKTIGHEMLCGISARVPRVYIKSGNVVKIMRNAFS